MKKIFLSALLFVMLISMSVEKAEATCPTGFTEYTQTITYGGCEWTVIFCVKCGITNPYNEVWIQQFSIQYGCYDYFMSHSQEVIDAIAANVTVLSADICGIKPPCGSGIRYTYVYVATCWQNMHVVNSTENYFVQRFCSDLEFCKSTYSTCWDYSVTPAVPVLTLVGKQYYGDPQCARHNNKPSDFDNPNPNNWSSCWEEFLCE
jgi:hypothetical protein